jgi:hypothetical protein
MAVYWGKFTIVQLMPIDDITNNGQYGKKRMITSIRSCINVMMMVVTPMKVRHAALDIDLAKFVRLERANWRTNKLLSSRALQDFQKLTDEAFLDLQHKYFRPVDLVAEIARRRRVNPKKNGKPA